MMGKKTSIKWQDIQHLLLSEVERTAHLSSDTRLLQPGDVFLAYPVGSGAGLSDNRMHIPKALELGVSLVLYQSDDWSENDHVQARATLGDTRCYAVPQLANIASEIANWWYDYPSHAMKIVGVTGTNGKTTVTHWLAQAFTKSKNTAVFGTLGYGEIGKLKTTGFTTPDASRVQRVLAELKSESIEYVAMEVSSHALEQRRVGDVEFKTAIFTNLSQDHLDYHGNMHEYARAKFELFRFPNLEHMIINIDDHVGRQWIEQVVQETKATVWAYGSTESFAMLACQSRVKSVLIEQYETTKSGVRLNCLVNGQSCALQLDLIGRFNVDNTMAVLACLLADEVPLETAMTLIKQLKSVPGRLEMINFNDTNHPLMVVDFAHTPDALEKVLEALKPIAKARGGQLICVFGCGGNRDRGKRPIMGKIAALNADRVILTSDNPRTENPEDILQQIMQGVDTVNQDKISIVPDRAFAILTSVKQSLPNDTVLVAGKGHESYQEIDGKQFAFSDQEHIRIALRGVM